eukprot:CAMPEP_0177680450 /NCGR_PEP_ID=MMETSP0447-20121125/30178_1 /TAXON_ID=0 /ORGANISM="Stygamoeba regulata, Strain BSH-02190019" /LENGTH=968 /DNA_ID=CAMNT_0019189779 /DNA_START=104 /DNA_END=3010 /DNA_ORIENTATION=-
MSYAVLRMAAASLSTAPRLSAMSSPTTSRSMILTSNHSGVLSGRLSSFMPGASSIAPYSSLVPSLDSPEDEPLEYTLSRRHPYGQNDSWQQRAASPLLSQQSTQTTLPSRWSRIYSLNTQRPYHVGSFGSSSSHRFPAKDPAEPTTGVDKETSKAQKKSTLEEEETALIQEESSEESKEKSFKSKLKELPATLMALTPAKVWSGLKTVPGKIRAELHHFWVGTKLLGLNVRTAYRVVRRILDGKQITRREQRLLKMTVADVFRMVPLIIFFVIPLLEFALPFVLMIFPEMLPSTFQDALKKVETRKKQLKVKLEVAKFLQETATELAPTNKHSRAAQEAFATMMTKVRAGEILSADEIVGVAKHFKDEVTLDQLGREQLVALCRLLNQKPFGTTGFLRYRLKRVVQDLKKDDRLIAEEGVKELNLEELQQACQARGMRSLNLSANSMRKQLEQWLELSLHRDVPISLLIMSRAFLLTARERKPAKVAEELQEIMSTLPEGLLEEVELELDGANNDRKLEVLKHHLEQLAEDIEEEPDTQKLIDREKREASSTAQRLGEMISSLSADSALAKERAEIDRLREEKEEFAAQRAKEAAEKEAQEAQEAQERALAEAAAEAEARLVAAQEAAEQKLTGETDGKATSAAKSEEKAARDLAAKEEKLVLSDEPKQEQQQQQQQLSDEPKQQQEQQQQQAGDDKQEQKQQKRTDSAAAADDKASEVTSLATETEEVAVTERTSGEEVAVLDAEAAAEAAESLSAEELARQQQEEEQRAKKKRETATTRLSTRVDKMLASLVSDLSEAEAELGESFHLLDLDHDGVITVNELEGVLSYLKEIPSESELADVLSRLDPDSDGKISLEEMARLAESGNAGDVKLVQMMAELSKMKDANAAAIQAEKLKDAKLKASSSSSSPDTAEPAATLPADASKIATPVSKVVSTAAQKKKQPKKKQKKQNREQKESTAPAASSKA